MILPDSNSARMLIGYYGIFQFAHVIVNTRGLFLLYSGSPLDFPAPPPASGWPAETINFMIAIGWVDLMGAFLALVFVWAFFTVTKWRLWLGGVCLTISSYAAIVYAYWSIASDAWQDNLFVYGFVNIAFLPIAYLFYLSCRWGLSGQR